MSQKGFMLHWYKKVEEGGGQEVTRFQLEAELNSTYFYFGESVKHMLM